MALPLSKGNLLLPRTLCFFQKPHKEITFVKLGVKAEYSLESFSSYLSFLCRLFQILSSFRTCNGLRTFVGPSLRNTRLSVLSTVTDSAGKAGLHGLFYVRTKSHSPRNLIALAVQPVRLSAWWSDHEWAALAALFRNKKCLAQWLSAVWQHM